MAHAKQQGTREEGVSEIFVMRSLSPNISTSAMAEFRAVKAILLTVCCWQERHYDNFNCAFDFLPGDAGGVYPAIL